MTVRSVPTAAMLDGFDLTDPVDQPRGVQPPHRHVRHRARRPRRPTRRQGRVLGASANRDEGVFEASMSFDVARDPNPHLGFGPGRHFCLGASLARLELRVTLEELLGRVEGLEPAGEPDWTRSNNHTGLRHVPLRLHWAATRS